LERAHTRGKKKRRKKRRTRVEKKGLRRLLECNVQKGEPSSFTIIGKKNRLLHAGETMPE